MNPNGKRFKKNRETPLNTKFLELVPHVQARLIEQSLAHVAFVNSCSEDDVIYLHTVEFYAMCMRLAKEECAKLDARH